MIKNNFIVLRDIKNSGYKMVIVFSDDIISSERRFKDFLQIIVDNIKCSSRTSIKLLRGEYEFKGKKGRVITDGDNAVKINDEIGSFKITEKEAVFSSFFLQCVVSFLIEKVCQTRLTKDPRRQIITKSYSKCKDIYLCENKGFSVYERANKGGMDDFIKSNIDNPSFLDKILCESVYDVSLILDFLDSECSFIHNDMKIANVLVHQEGDEYSFKINDFDNSSMIYNGIKVIKEKNILENIVNNISSVVLKDEGGSFYSVSVKDFETGLSGDVFRALKHKPSLDIYTYILSIVFNKNIIKIINKLPMFTKFIHHIFEDKDVDAIREEISFTEPPLRIAKITSFIIDKKVFLRKDIMKRIGEFKH